MALKKKGQILMYWIMSAVVVFIIAMAFSEPLVESVTTATNASNLDCDNNANTIQRKATCVVIQSGLFYFIGSLVAASIAIISGKKTIPAIVISVFTFIVLSAMVMPLKGIITLFRDSSHLNCASTTLIGAKMACIVVDTWLFLFIIAALAATASYFVVKKVAPEE